MRSRIASDICKVRSAPSTTDGERRIPQAKKSKRSKNASVSLSNELHADIWSGSYSNRWRRRDDCSDSDKRSGTGHEPMENRVALRFLAGLCPDNRISGDKVLSRGTRQVINRAATALRIAASTLIRSKTYLGAQYRRLRTKLGAPKAITAMAHRLARLVYPNAEVWPRVR